MKNIFFMEIFESFANIKDDFGDVFFRYMVKFFLDAPKIPIKHGLQDHINIAWVIENSV